jgi:hypothetical protein
VLSEILHSVAAFQGKTPAKPEKHREHPAQRGYRSRSIKFQFTFKQLNFLIDSI